MPRCYSLSCRRFCFIMPRGVVILNHAARFLIIMPAVYIIMPRVHGSGSRSYCLSCRRSTSSCRGAYCLSGSGYMVQVAGLIAYHAARFLIIMPRGSALSCRGVLLFSIMPAVYIIMPRCLLPIRKRVHGSGSGSYCLSFRAVLNHHAARVYIIMPAV